MSRANLGRGTLSTEQMIALHGFFAEASAAGEASLAEQSGCETEVEVVEVRCVRLDEIGLQGLRACDDLAAAVMGRLDGALAGSAAVVLEPEDALVWARTANASDPIEAFIALGSAVLDGMASALGEVLRAKTSLEDARLVETTEPGLLASTHAPADTLVVSVRLRISVRDEAIPAVVHLLVVPKHFARLLSSLSAAVH